MATSVYFNNQGATREQFLVEDLIIESIRNHGIDIFYLPMSSHDQIDPLFGDDPVKSYNIAYKLDMYMETFNSFEGQQEFFSKFGLNIDKTARVAVARRTFERFVGSKVRRLPKEGDLIWLPVQQKLMEIRFVEEEKNFFQLGKIQPYMYALSLEAFKYNGELLNTGIEEIDIICNTTTPSVLHIVQDIGSPKSFKAGEAVYQGANYASANASAYVSSFDKTTLELNLRNIKGTFQSNVNIVGTESTAYFRLASYNVLQDNSTVYDDNLKIETEADAILDFTETNPFGEP
jgi:hypothetical protein